MEMSMEMDELDIHSILDEYHRKQLLENLCGPATSLVVHLVILTLMFIYVVTKPAIEPPAIEVSIVEQEIKEIDPEVLDEIIDPEIEESTMEDQPMEPSDANQENVGENVSVDDFSDDAPETDDNSMDNNVMDVVAIDSPLTLTGLTGGMQNRGKKGDSVKKYGGSPRGLSAVNKALKWLAKVQNQDGSWGDAGDKPAYTGMALLVFLAHGETPLSETYGNTVQNAMKWLSTAVNESANGQLGRAYTHGIATYALSESYAMTRIPFLRTAMEKALSVIIYGQQNGGGYDYNYKKGERWDNSVSGWQFQALKAGYVAGATNEGLEDAIRKAILFERRTAYKNNKFGYASPGSGGNMTGVGVVSLQLLGSSKCSEVKNGIETIATERLKLYQEVATNPKKWDEVAGQNMYGWYYDTQAMFNANGAKKGKGTKEWRQWRSSFEKVLLRHQQPEGYWEVQKGHGMGPNLNGRILATCWSALQLEVYYRYLPTFDIKKMDKHAVEEGSASIEDAAGGELVIEID